MQVSSHPCIKNKDFCWSYNSLFCQLLIWNNTLCNILCYNYVFQLHKFSLNFCLFMHHHLNSIVIIPKLHFQSLFLTCLPLHFLHFVHVFSSTVLYIVHTYMYIKLIKKRSVCLCHITTCNSKNVFAHF